MAWRVDEGDDRTSIGDVVLWLALAALMAVVILGAATLIRLQPSLTAEIRSGTQIALPIQHSRIVGTVAPRASRQAGPRHVQLTETRVFPRGAADPSLRHRSGRQSGA